MKVIDGREDEIKRIMEGITAMRNTMNSTSIDKDAAKNSIIMYKLGHKDIVDNLLYSIAVSRKLKLLTVDKELIKFVKKHNFPKEHIITP